MRVVLCGIGTVVALISIQGCRSAGAASNSLEGGWTLSSPMLGQGTMRFEGNKYTQRNGLGQFSIETTGTFTLVGANLTLQPTNVKIGGDEAAFSMSMYKGLKKLSTMVLGVTWSGSDIVYLKAEDSNANGSASMVMALSRNGAKPDPKKLELSFEMHTSGGGGWQVQRAPDDSTTFANPTRPGPARTEPTSSGSPIQAAPQPSAPPTAPPPADVAPQDNPPAQPETAPTAPPTQPTPAQPDPTQPTPPDPNQPQPSTTGGGRWRLTPLRQ